MSTFKDYSQYYDLLYLDKDYKGEVKYITNLINKAKAGEIKGKIVAIWEDKDILFDTSNNNIKSYVIM